MSNYSSFFMGFFKALFISKRPLAEVVLIPNVDILPMIRYILIAKD